jgi:hypothetical protein
MCIRKLKTLIFADSHKQVHKNHEFRVIPNLLISTLIHFRIEMEVNSSHVENFRKIEEVKSDEEITDVELDIKIEKSDEQGKIKTEVFEENNYSEPLQIIGEKRKHRERANLENKSRKFKKEFVVLEELDDQQEPNQEPEDIQEISLYDSEDQVFYIYLP